MGHQVTKWPEVYITDFTLFIHKFLRSAMDSNTFLWSKSGYIRVIPKFVENKIKKYLLGAPMWNWGKTKNYEKIMHEHTKYSS